MPTSNNKLVIIAGGSTINISFNPSEYSLDKGNTFSEASIPGLGSPVLQFSSGQAKTLSLELLLDTYAYDSGEDIRKKYIEKLDKLTEIDGELHAPPICKVLWGSLEFDGVCEKVTKKYILFKDDGTPVRARVTLTFKEYIPIEIQIKRPPRSSPDRLKKYVIQEGDSLWQLSHKAYGDPYQWRFIAEANGIDNPLALEPGQELFIPPLARR